MSLTRQTQEDKLDVTRLLAAVQSSFVYITFSDTDPRAFIWNFFPFFTKMGPLQIKFNIYKTAAELVLFCLFPQTFC